jgi:hypothetical protein
MVDRLLRGDKFTAAYVADGSGVPVRHGRNRSFTARPPAPIAEYPVSNVKRPFGRLVVE